MPIESTPTLTRVPDSTPVRSAAPGPLDALTLGAVAPSQVVDPLLRAARGRLAALQLEARTAERAADAAEAALSTDVEAEGSGSVARSAELEAELEARRHRGEVELEAARREAEDVVAHARLDAEAMVGAARAELERSLLGRPGASPEPAPAPVPPITPASSYPPPAATTPAASAAPPVAPPAPPASTPAPAPAPPMAATPLAGAVSYSTVLVQAPDGTFQQAIVMTPGPSPVVPGSPMVTSMFTSSVPGAVAAAPSRPAARRLLHLDVILPLLAVLIVLVVLLAWLG